MINILASSHRARAINLADRILENLPADPTFGGRYTQADVHNARAEIVLRAGQCVAEVDRIHRQMAEDAHEFVRLTNDYLAGHPLALGDFSETNEGGSR